MKSKVAIITPVYNGRAHIFNLWNSLKRSFDGSLIVEWIIVEDGSSIKIDEEFHKECLKYDEQIEVKYFYKENGGKHSAINFSFQHLSSDYFTIVDVDDVLSENFFVELLLITKSGKDFVLVDKKVNGFCSSQVKTFSDEDLIRFYYLNRVELTPIIRRSINLPILPEFKGENRFPELYWFSMLSTYFGGNTVLLGKGILDCKYYPDGITLNFKKNLPLNYKGFLLYYKEVIKHFSILELYYWAFLYRIVYLKFCHFHANFIGDHSR
jgi:glycosyltransferase involved in cell wall biosynthesis